MITTQHSNSTISKVNLFILTHLTPTCLQLITVWRKIRFGPSVWPATINQLSLTSILVICTRLLPPPMSHSGDTSLPLLHFTEMKSTQSSSNNGVRELISNSSSWDMLWLPVPTTLLRERLWKMKSRHTFQACSRSSSKTQWKMSTLLTTNTKRENLTLQVQLKTSISLNIHNHWSNITLKAKLKPFNHNMKAVDTKEEA